VHDLNPLRRGIEVGDVVAALRFLIDSGGHDRPDAGRSTAGSASWRCRAMCNFLETE
jgi:hypothetical protein